MPGVPSVWVPTLPVDELAKALLDRGDRHRRTDSVMLPVSSRHADDLALCRACAARQSGAVAHQTGDLLQIATYRVAAEAAAHRFPQVRELLKARSAPRLPLRRGPLTGSLFELHS